MKKKSLALAATGIVLFISIEFIQCSSPSEGKEQGIETSDIAFANKSASESDTKATHIDEPTAIKSAEFSLKSVKASIKGTSTLHAWESQITMMEGKGSFQSKDDTLSVIKDVEIKIDVNGIKSKEGKKMDKKTYEAFKSDKNPFITYSFNNALVKISASHDVTIEATGNLSMAGTTNSVSLSATGKMLPNGDLQLTASKQIKMTDYNMVPPVMFLRTIKVGNEITVSFDFVLARSKKETNQIKTAL
ncbi:MAG: YceI family protein [Bacteroidia bacterium]